MGPERCEWRHATEALAEDFLYLRKVVTWVPASERENRDSELGEARRICALRAPHVGWVESWRYKSSQHRKILSLSSCRKTFKLKKVNKSFVPEPISCFRIPIYVYEHFMNIMSISHIRIMGMLQYDNWFKTRKNLNSNPVNTDEKIDLVSHAAHVQLLGVLLTERTPRQKKRNINSKKYFKSLHNDREWW